MIIHAVAGDGSQITALSSNPRYQEKAIGGQLAEFTKFLGMSGSSDEHQFIRTPPFLCFLHQFSVKRLAFFLGRELKILAPLITGER